jgi:hypothetical protein
MPSLQAELNADVKEEGKARKRCAPLVDVIVVFLSLSINPKGEFLDV